MEKIKILYILSGTMMGGATLSALTLIEQMRNRGCEVIVVSPNMNPPFQMKLENLGVSWYKVYFRFHSYPRIKDKWYRFKYPIRIIRLLFINYKAKNEISNIILNNGIDIVHTNVGPIECGYKACLKVNVPHVWHIREYGDKDFNIHMFPSQKNFRNMLKKSHVISITQELIYYNNLESSSTAHVIYNGVRKKADVRYEYPKKKYFLCASRVSPEKGFVQTIRVFAQFHNSHPDYKLIIIGLDPNNYTPTLKKMAKDCGVVDAIEFGGFKENVSDYMAHATALIVSSPYEGFGRMTAESAFAGCLVVGKNVAGTKEIMKITGGYPFVTDEEMLSSLEKVCTLSEKEYQEKALYAQSQAVSCFSEESYIDKVFNLYKLIVNQKRRTCYPKVML